MGEVFLAKTGTEGIERVCVLKTVRADHAGVEEYARRFVDEARVAVQLNHANICHVFDVGRVDDTLYLAMEYIPGVNLRDLLFRLSTQKKRLDPGISLYFIEELLDALAHAHRQEHPLTGEDLAVVHRDVSPHNVMINFEGEVKLIDFGLAASALKEENTESHLVMGKVAYMSPEQATGIHVDGRVDQFAAGILLYELMAGERYYGEMATHEVWQIVGRGGHVPRKWDALSATAQGVISRALHPDFRQRFADCEEFRVAVAELRAELSPRAGKTEARALMQEVYRERIAQQRSLLLSFADVPLTVEARATSGAIAAPSSADADEEKSTEQERLQAQLEAARNLTADAASRSDSIGHLGYSDDAGQVSPQSGSSDGVRPAPFDLPDSSLTNQERKFVESVLAVDSPLEESASASATNAALAAVRPNGARRWALLGVPLLLALLVGGIWIQRTPSTPDEAPEPAVLATAPDPERFGPPPKAEAEAATATATPPPTPEAPPVAEATPGGSETKLRDDPRARRRARRRPAARTPKEEVATPEPVVAVVEPVPVKAVAEPVSEDPSADVAAVEPKPKPKVEPAPPPKPKRTVSQNIAILNRCTKGCARLLKGLVTKKGRGKLVKRDLDSIDFCAEKCTE